MDDAHSAGLSYVFFVFSGIAAAAAIQELYERAFDLEARGRKDAPRRLAWPAALLGFAALGSWAGPTVHATGGPVLLAVLGLVALTSFWWFTMWLLLGVSFSLMSVLIAVGVVIILGAVIGVVWRLRRTITRDGEAADT